MADRALDRLAPQAYRRLPRNDNALAPGDMLSNQPDNRRPDGTSEPTTPFTGLDSGQPWSAPSGDPVYGPPSYSPGYPSPPRPPNPDYPPTSEFAAAPTEQLPPGYDPPGYGPPGYGDLGYPPQPQPGPPGRPPRKSSLPIVAVLAAVSLLLCGGVATAGVLIARNAADRAERAIEELPSAAPQLPDLPTDLPTDLPSLPAVPHLDGHKIKVTYEVSGEGQASQIIYLAKIGETPKRLQNVDLPWKFTTEMETPALVSVIAMRIGTSGAKISCRASVDGAEVKQSASSTGNVATATCTHFAIS